jgi:hypothetical protein
MQGPTVRDGGEVGHRQGDALRLPLWRLVPWVLCVLLPLPGLAQASSAPRVPAPSTAEAAPSESDQGDPYGGYDDEDAPQANEPQDDEPQGEIIPRQGGFSWERGKTAARIAVESLSGLTLGLAGIAPGAYLGFVLAASESSSNSGSDNVLGVIGLGFVGVTLGTTLGVWGGGSLLGGEGLFLDTLVGAALGAMAGAVLAIPAALAVEGGWIVPALVLPFTGAMIAYEQSHSQEHARKGAVAGTRVELVPVISVRPSSGLVAGLAGRF